MCAIADAVSSDPSRPAPRPARRPGAAASAPSPAAAPGRAGPCTRAPAAPASCSARRPPASACAGSPPAPRHCVRLRDLDVVAEDAVVADLQRLDARPLALPPLEVGQVLPRVARDRAQRVEFRARTPAGSRCPPAGRPRSPPRSASTASAHGCRPVSIIWRVPPIVAPGASSASTASRSDGTTSSPCPSAARSRGVLAPRRSAAAVEIRDQQPLEVRGSRQQGSCSPAPHAGVEEQLHTVQPRRQSSVMSSSGCPSQRRSSRAPIAVFVSSSTRKQRRPGRSGFSGANSSRLRAVFGSMLMYPPAVRQDSREMWRAPHAGSLPGRPGHAARCARRQRPAAQPQAVQRRRVESGRAARSSAASGSKPPGGSGVSVATSPSGGAEPCGRSSSAGARRSTSAAASPGASLQAARTPRSRRRRRRAALVPSPGT